jgi:hypothetical protein
MDSNKMTVDMAAILFIYRQKPGNKNVIITSKIIINPDHLKNLHANAVFW